MRYADCCSIPCPALPLEQAALYSVVGVSQDCCAVSLHTPGILQACGGTPERTANCEMHPLDASLMNRTVLNSVLELGTGQGSNTKSKAPSIFFSNNVCSRLRCDQKYFAVSL